MTRSDSRAGRTLQRAATAPLAAAGLIAGFAVAVVTGSRPIGGLVLAAFGLTCIAIWLRRDGTRTAVGLTVAGLAAFAASHLLGLLIGPWPAVLLVAAVIAAVCWRVSDSPRPRAEVRSRAGAGSPRKPLPADRPGRSA